MDSAGYLADMRRLWTVLAPYSRSAPSVTLRCGACRPRRRLAVGIARSWEHLGFPAPVIEDLAGDRADVARQRFGPQGRAWDILNHQLGVPYGAELGMGVGWETFHTMKPIVAASPDGGPDYRETFACRGSCRARWTIPRMKAAEASAAACQAGRTEIVAGLDV
jgi:hypothetical protein